MSEPIWGLIVFGVIVLVIVLLVINIGRTIAGGFRGGPDEDDIEESARAWGSGVGPAPGQAGPIIPAGNLPPVLTRTYFGKPSDVEILRAADAEALAKRGYFPSAQGYVEGQWGCGDFLGALLLCIFLVGILIFIYMLIVKPGGTLTVTYARTDPGVAAPTAVPPLPQVAGSPISDVDARLATLERLRSTGTITEDEFAARRNKILDEI
jgi:uncharacterized membrane protein